MRGWGKVGGGGGRERGWEFPEELSVYSMVYGTSFSFSLGGGYGGVIT